MGQTYQSIRIALTEIDADLRPARLHRAKIHAWAVEEYRESFADLPRTQLMQDAADRNHYWLVDGSHTITAARDLKLADVVCDVIGTGTFHDAFAAAGKCNEARGLRRTNEDKRASVVNALADPEMATWSNRRLAEVCGVSHVTVNRIRPDQLEHCSSSSESGKRVGRDGKARSAPTPDPDKPKRPRKPKGEPTDEAPVPPDGETRTSPGSGQPTAPADEPTLNPQHDVDLPTPPADHGPVVLPMPSKPAPTEDAPYEAFDFDAIFEPVRAAIYAACSAVPLRFRHEIAMRTKQAAMRIYNEIGAVTKEISIG